MRINLEQEERWMRNNVMSLIVDVAHYRAGRVPGATLARRLGFVPGRRGLLSFPLREDNAEYEEAGSDRTRGAAGAVATIGPEGSLKLNGERLVDRQASRGDEPRPASAYRRVLGAALEGTAGGRGDLVAHQLQFRPRERGIQKGERAEMNKPVNQASHDLLDRRVQRRGFLKYVLLGFSALAAAAGTVSPIISYL